LYQKTMQLLFQSLILGMSATGNDVTLKH
jgi:hypothetical protein